MCRRPVTGGEHLSGDDERSRVGSEVLEEIGETVEEEESLRRGDGGAELVVAEAHDDKEDGEHDKAHELDGFAAPAVDEEEGCVVSGNETCCRENQVADAGVVERGPVFEVAR